MALQTLRIYGEITQAISKNVFNDFREQEGLFSFN
jgi:hypothetical protein